MNKGVQNILYLLGGVALGILLNRLLAASLQPGYLKQVLPLAQQFTTIFLGIYVEALPFLLMGVIASGFVEEFLKPDFFASRQPANRIGAVLPAALMGMAVPVCECGIVPLTRRLMHKGLKPASAIAFLLATPAANPVVLFSTWAATGSIRFVIARALAGVLIAALVGFVFSFEENPLKIVKLTRSATTSKTPGKPAGSDAAAPPRFRIRVQASVRYGAEDFFDTNRYLVIGALLASLLQLLVPQSFLLELGTNPLGSHITMLTLAGLLSICSTVDAFVALAFTNTFSSGSIFAFLVFGPMVDIKSVSLYLGTFTRKTVLYIVILTSLLTLAASGIIDAAGLL